MDQEKNKRRRKLIIIIVSAVVLLGCCIFALAITVLKTAKQMLDSETVCDTYLEEVIDTMNRDDAAAAYRLFANGVPYEEFADGFEQIVKRWDGSGEYEYKKTSINISVSGGRKTVTCSYRIETQQNTYQAELVRVEKENGEQGIYRFNIVSNEAEAAAEPVGRLRDVSRFNGIQWLLLAFSAAALVFTILAEVHCIRHTVRLKWLWLILIPFLYAMGGVSLTGNQISLRGYVTILGYSRLLIYPEKGAVLSVFIPLGAILYCCLYQAIRIKPESGGGQAEPENPAGT